MPTVENRYVSATGSDTKGHQKAHKKGLSLWHRCSPIAKCFAAFD
jgi:hypothetical protein